ncbi:MAG: hypothetical protein AAB804_01230 [Patescibacteria group bacterium]
MPPQTQAPFDPTDHLLPPGHRSSTGPTVGIAIILILLIIGALYFWDAGLKRGDRNDNLPLIPADNSAQ